MRSSGQKGQSRRQPCNTRSFGRDQLVSAVIQPEHWTLLHSRVGKGGVINYLGKTSLDTGITPMPDVKLVPNYRTDAEGYGIIRAFDPRTGEKKWEYKMGDTTWAGVLTTAGDVLFSGGREGYFYALNARTGELLWKIPLGGQINSGAMSYSVNGKQYVAVAAGTSLFSFALR